MQRSIISLINDLKEKCDLTIVFITHDLPLVADLADRLAVITPLHSSNSDRLTISSATRPRDLIIEDEVIEGINTVYNGNDEFKTIANEAADPRAQFTERL